MENIFRLKVSPQFTVNVTYMTQFCLKYALFLYHFCFCQYL